MIKKKWCWVKLTCVKESFKKKHNLVGFNQSVFGYWTWYSKTTYSNSTKFCFFFVCLFVFFFLSVIHVSSTQAYNNIRTAKSITVFKKQLKTHLLSETFSKVWVVFSHTFCFNFVCFYHVSIRQGLFLKYGHLRCKCEEKRYLWLFKSIWACWIQKWWIPKIIFTSWPSNLHKIKMAAKILNLGLVDY